MDEDKQAAEAADPAATDSPWARRKLLAIRLAAGVAAAAVVGTTGYMIGHGEVSRLQKAVLQLETEKAAVAKQYEELRVSYSQTISMQRCEVIDGLDDCLAAGLKRPPRFAESDRQILEARRVAELQRLAEEAARAPKPEAAVPATAGAAPDVKAEAKSEVKAETKAEGASEGKPSASKKKLSMSEFLEEIKKIPGVGIEPGQQERPGADKKDKARR